MLFGLRLIAGSNETSDETSFSIKPLANLECYDAWDSD